MIEIHFETDVHRALGGNRPMSVLDAWNRLMTTSPSTRRALLALGVEVAPVDSAPGLVEPIRPEIWTDSLREVFGAAVAHAQHAGVNTFAVYHLVAAMAASPDMEFGAYRAASGIDFDQLQRNLERESRRPLNVPRADIRPGTRVEFDQRVIGVLDSAGCDEFGQGGSSRSIATALVTDGEVSAIVEGLGIAVRADVAGTDDEMAEDPAIGIVVTAGRRAMERGSQTVGLGDLFGAFAVSADTGGAQWFATQGIDAQALAELASIFDR